MLSNKGEAEALELLWLLSVICPSNHCTMSWQEHVGSLLLPGHIKHAAIHGHNGAPWASSAGMPLEYLPLFVIMHLFV
jgi:hypothetical protein